MILCLGTRQASSQDTKSLTRARFLLFPSTGDGTSISQSPAKAREPVPPVPEAIVLDSLDPSGTKAPSGKKTKVHRRTSRTSRTRKKKRRKYSSLSSYSSSSGWSPRSTLYIYMYIYIYVSVYMLMISFMVTYIC